jgi:hypothetical protein
MAGEGSQGALRSRAGAQDGKCALLKNNTVSRQSLHSFTGRVAGTHSN